MSSVSGLCQNFDFTAVSITSVRFRWFAWRGCAKCAKCVRGWIQLSTFFTHLLPKKLVIILLKVKVLTHLTHISSDNTEQTRTGIMNHKPSKTVPGLNKSPDTVLARLAQRVRTRDNTNQRSWSICVVE